MAMLIFSFLKSSHTSGSLYPKKLIMLILQQLAGRNPQLLPIVPELAIAFCPSDECIPENAVSMTVLMLLLLARINYDIS